MKADLKIESWPIAKLTGYEANPREHSKAQITQIAASIKEFGFVNPCLVDANGTLIAGHGRVAAAKTLKHKNVPVIQLGHLTEVQARALRIADNSIALNSAWDVTLLQSELSGLKLAEFDLDLLGFDGKQLVSFFANIGGKDPDDAPEAPTEPVTRPGDLWVLGAHRLLCGDCTKAADVQALLGGAKPHLMVTDPPYGVEYDADWRTHARNKDGSLLSHGNNRAVGKVTNDDRANWIAAWALFPGDVVYAWSPASSMLVDHHNALVAAGFECRMLLIWAKQKFVIGRGHYHAQHEPCWYAIRKGATAHWHGDRKQSTLWQIDKPQKCETGHSTQKPIECMKRPIENNSKFGEAVYDPFVGSGTTIIAAEMTGRVCYAMEITPAYVDVCVRRWQDYAKGEAVLESTGETFAEVAARMGK